MSKLILMRHGETAKNTQGIVHHVADQESLTELGRQQVKAATHELQQFMPLVLFSSSEQRAVETAEIVSQELGIQVQHGIQLHERNWGELANKPWQSIQDELDKMSLDERYAFVPPGGESWQQFEQRLVAAINQLVIKHPNQDLLVVTHGGVIRALAPILLNQPRETSFQYEPANASLQVFDIVDQN